ncbi:hypothetical protein [Variovorax sp. J22R115]|uniref:hypothetical protein n=1 Tax=Variovorax sp. J22R115 TaxID=3053509 RepID=UPI002576905B|nr:hypothetical protein [Variovorax sp. J22R115]MDM0047920.1 hypothetical protein [Variovorax sp. J22R115]
MTPLDTPRDERAHPWQFDEFVREGLSLIPAYAPEWTNHNTSDPGITLIELFAYLSEILTYRALRVTPDAKLNLLRLLEGPEWDGWRELLGAPVQQVDEAIRLRMQALSHAQCAITPEDFERAALEAARRHLGPHERVRAFALAGADLRRGRHEQFDSAAPGAPEELGDVSVVLAPERELDADALERLCRDVQDELAPRCLLTTRAHVVGPVYLHVFVGCRLGLEAGASLAHVRAAIDAALRRRYGPLSADEPSDIARSFGRALHLSEIAEVIDRVEGIDWVDDIAVHRIATRTMASADARIGVRIGVASTLAEDARLGGVVSIPGRRLMRDPQGEVTSVALHPWELARVQLERDAMIDASQAPLPGARRPSGAGDRP